MLSVVNQSVDVILNLSSRSRRRCRRNRSRSRTTNTQNDFWCSISEQHRHGKYVQLLMISRFCQIACTFTNFSSDRTFEMFYSCLLTTRLHTVGLNDWKIWLLETVCFLVPCLTKSVDEFVAFNENDTSYHAAYFGYSVARKLHRLIHEKNFNCFLRP